MIMLQDGVIWRVLEKGAQPRDAFQDRLLDVIRDMGRGESMQTFAHVYRHLRRKTGGSTRCWGGLRLFSVLLITAYACMMRSSHHSHRSA